MTQDGRKHRRHVDHMKRRYTGIATTVQGSPYYSWPEDESHEDNRCPTSLSSGAECETEDAPAAFDSSPNAYADSASEAGTQEKTQPTQRSQPVPDGRPRSRYGRILKAPERLAM
ncbi:hypothetical protein MTO96_017071 [Rhipicephalus appendiculatus]